MTGLITHADKLRFLLQEFVSLLQNAPTETKAGWGKMTLQQMVEHFADSICIASGKTVVADILTPPEQLDKMRSFLESDKPFRENTPNPLMPEVPAPVRNHSLKAALKELKEELADFNAFFQKNSTGVTRNPFFGDLNFEQNVQLLYKHALHHLKQFGIATNATTV